MELGITDGDLLASIDGMSECSNVGLLLGAELGSVDDTLVNSING